MNEIELPDVLVNQEGHVTMKCFCVPIIIAPIPFGPAIASKNELDFETTDEGSIRNGTLTFVKHNGDILAITCKHVNDALIEANKNADEYYKGVSTTHRYEYGFYSPVNNVYVHFNYELLPIQNREPDEDLDIAIARIDNSYLHSVRRDSLPVTDKPLPSSGCAFGYPETARMASEYKDVGVLNTVGVACMARMESANFEKIRLQDTITDLQGINNLSGMSGGPISGGNTLNLFGMVTEGRSLLPTEDSLDPGTSILITGQRITSTLLDRWLSQVPVGIQPIPSHTVAVSS